MVRGKLKKMPMYLIKRLDEETGRFWFSPSTMRFFKSKVGKTAYVRGKKAFFVSSEQFTSPEYTAPRKYTVRIANLKTGDIHTYSREGFQEFPSRADAMRKVRELIRPKKRKKFNLERELKI